MTLRLPDELPEAITVDRDVAAYFLAENLAEWGETGPVGYAWRWALYGEGPRPVSGLPWRGGLPGARDLEGETWFDSGWGAQASYAEVGRAKFTLWWLQAPAGAEVPDRFVPGAPVR